MLCEKIQMQLPLEGLEVVPTLKPKLTPQDEMENSVEDHERERKKQYLREWHKNHPEKSREYYRNYYQKHKDLIREQRNTPEKKQRRRAFNRAYRFKHKEKLDSYFREWKAKNQGHIKAYRQNYGQRRRELYQARKEEICARKRELSHTAEYRFQRQSYFHRQRRENIQFALKDRLRASINRSLRRNWVRKSKRTMEMVGCTVEELKAHLERQFVDGMTWDNRRTWHVDHYVPIAAFDLTDSEEQKWAFNWRNLRPLHGHENHVKADTIPDPLPDWLTVEIKRRIKQRY